VSLMTKRGRFLVLYCVLAAILQAESPLGSFLGTVRSSSGAPVSMCMIAITNVETGVMRSLLTDANGKYVARNLQPGNYEILMEAPGFGQSRFANVELEAGHSVRIDGKLSLALQARTVAAAVRTESKQ
jgi:hypothetical protein